ncbi:TadE/TadG family type IV pilus assembly protein [Brevundimonas sp. PAMC22021]|uniref:TadE/TadG family type IV pilus assembly protein n=1 Tax=Brevundimonas sp. PAMC22021 TaxID=2861285 RepID=UPI001C624C27|nr:TadE/TadG family type IV pilus assembly protein [Brevundimonas sp. PAMC22021]QYF86116.1 pilus assembly protein [Brevundimonas sp. PAMC22021]
MSRRALQRLMRDRRGVSAVEFALIAPVMIGLYFAMTEFSQGFMAQKRMNHVAAVVGDLVGQVNTLTTSDLDGILDVGDLVMAPYPVDTLKLRVSSVIRQNDVYTVQWSRGSNWSGADAPIVPDGLISNGQTVIVSEIKYTYVSAVNFSDGVNLSHTAYNLPRDTAPVTLTP